MAFCADLSLKMSSLHQRSHATPSHDYSRLAIGRIERQEVIDCSMSLGEGKLSFKGFRSFPPLITVTLQVHS